MSKSSLTSQLINDIDTLPGDPNRGAHNAFKESRNQSTSQRNQPEEPQTPGRPIVRTLDADRMRHSPTPENFGMDLEKVISYFEGIKSKPVVSPSVPRFSFYSEKTGLVRASSFSSLDLTSVCLTVRETLSTPFWIDITAPTEHEIDEIGSVFNLHPLTKEDILDVETREKCEVFNRYYFVVVRTFEQDQYKQNYLGNITMCIVIFDECVLSFQSAANPHARNVRRRIDQLASYGDESITAEWINYALLDDVCDSFMPLMRITELEVDAIEELVLIPVLKSDYLDMDMLRRIGMTRKRVMQVSRLLSTKSDVIKTIINRYNNSRETRYYLEDIHDHVATLSLDLSHYEKSLGRSHSNYLAQISIDITQASNRTSDTVMRMTLLASILVPLNVITGLFGMNVNVPGQGEPGLLWFYGIILGMLALITVTYFIVRRLNLL